MGCNGGCNGGSGSCSSGACNGNYGPVADAFTLVSDNYNSVTNFIPKRGVYRSVQVVDKAVENTNARGGCCDSDKNCCDTSAGEPITDAETLGFLMFPSRPRPETMTICSKLACNCGKKSNQLNNSLYTGGGEGCCGKSNCVELENHGFVAWPPIGYFRDVKACGPIIQNACKKHKRNNCKRCNVVAKCDTKKCKPCHA